MKQMFFLYLLVSQSYAATLTAMNTPYNYQNAPEYQAILSQIESFGEFSDKVSHAVKTMSRGQLAVAEAKARNRAILAEKNKTSQPTEELSQLEKWKKEEKETLQHWKKESADTLKQWQKEQDIFLGRIKIYQENTFIIPVTKEVIIEKKLKNLPSVHIVNGAFSVPIKDQYNRATCSAFAGVRALEVLLAQNRQVKDLSEQYFYWASKPKCHTSPCSEKGSWVNSALNHSKNQKMLDIPNESNCSYRGDVEDKNETQIPLGPECKLGLVKVETFTEVRTLADTIEKLKQNIPVIMAAKLSSNFYKNSGLVTLADSTKDLGLKLDGHSLGHAFLGVGVVELPQKLKATEGDFCIIIANSWGKGWGAGGYACLSEKWLVKFRQPAPFVAVNKISI